MILVNSHLSSQTLSSGIAFYYEDQQVNICFGEIEQNYMFCIVCTWSFLLRSSQSWHFFVFSLGSRSHFLDSLLNNFGLWILRVLCCADTGLCYSCSKKVDITVVTGNWLTRYKSCTQINAVIGTWNTNSLLAAIFFSFCHRVVQRLARALKERSLGFCFSVYSFLGHQ